MKGKTLRLFVLLFVLLQLVLQVKEKRSLEKAFIINSTDRTSESSTGSTVKRNNVRSCTSPERTVLWPTSGTSTTAVKSRSTSSFTCGTEESNNSSPFNRYLTEHTLPELAKYGTECKRLVVYGVAFGGEYSTQRLLSTNTKQQQRVKSDELIQKHGHCFFMFSLEEDLPDTNDQYMHPSSSSIKRSRNTAGHTRLVGIPKSVLPYANLRRSANLFKFHGHFLFPYAERIVWQDAEFLLGSRERPADYFAANYNPRACVSATALPPYRAVNGLGSENIEKAIQREITNNNNKQPSLYHRPQYIQHCETIIKALKKRPNVTDSAENVMNQCQSYLLSMRQQQEQQQLSVSDSSTTMPFSLDYGLIDTDFLVWNQGTEECRTFNAELQCTLSDELQCHSDRDQVSFPYAFAQMGLRVKKQLPEKEEEDLDQRRHDVQLVVDDDHDHQENTSSTVAVHITKSACHWNLRWWNHCKDYDENKPSVAVLVAGSAHRFLLNSTVHHLLRPLVHDENFVVDYYAFLTRQASRGFRQDASYMNHIVGDPTVRTENTTSLDFQIRNSIEGTGASIGALRIEEQLLDVNAVPELIAKQRQAEKLHPTLDVDLRFPMLDMRPSARKRTATGNRNILRLFYSLQLLWDEHLLVMEYMLGRRYDYVMILRDDTYWMQDFRMDKLLATNPTAGAYVLSCDARAPPMLSYEMNDHGIVMKRDDKSNVLGRYFASLFQADLQECHRFARRTMKQLGSDRGCNSEMIFHWILDRANITVQGVPQSLLPFERSVVIRHKNGTEQYCFHKFCQSKHDPLQIPDTIPVCSELVF